MKKGFTLIELLIVVAIIAILAAIAVPNFLEAQVRSKVARVKADQRSLATGIEAYFVDNNLYPVAAREGSGNCVVPNADVKVNAANNGNVNKYVPGQTTAQNYFSFAARGTTMLGTLTTPVAYITQYFPDPFADTKGVTFGYFANANGWILWSCGPDTDQATGTELGYNGSAGQNNVETVYDVAQAQPSPALNTWVVGSSPNDKSLTYDPSNGTISPGDVWRVKM